MWTVQLNFFEIQLNSKCLDFQMGNKFLLLLFILSIPFRVLFAICLALIQIFIRRVVRDSNWEEREEQKIASEEFQIVVTIIESYKIKFDVYPESFVDPELIRLMKAYLPVFSLFSYTKHEIGYEINVLNENLLDLELPDHFWAGLGICKTNISNFSKGEVEEFSQDSNQ